MQKSSVNRGVCLVNSTPWVSPEGAQYIQTVQDAAQYARGFQDAMRFAAVAMANTPTSPSATVAATTDAVESPAVCSTAGCGAAVIARDSQLCMQHSPFKICAFNSCTTPTRSKTKERCWKHGGVNKKKVFSMVFLWISMVFL